MSLVFCLVLDILFALVNDGSSTSPLTCTDADPLVSCVITLQTFTSVTGVHLRAGLSLLTGAHQAAHTVVQDQGHPRETHGGLLRTQASPRTCLGPDHCKHLSGRESNLLF